jgi:hypothetical protein
LREWRALEHGRRRHRVSPKQTCLTDADAALPFGTRESMSKLQREEIRDQKLTERIPGVLL